MAADSEKDVLKVLGKITEWIERLNYKTVQIKIELKDGTVLNLEKDGSKTIGF